MWSWKLMVLWSLWAARVVRQPTAAVRVSGGWLRGGVDPVGTHYHYLGVPYATITEKFQAPGPEPTWKGIYEADNENVGCVQELFIHSGIIHGRSDCLYLNVYVPHNTSPDDALPVMVYFHGGGFFEGSGTRLIYGPNYLITKGVILVTVNYRINVQGFLCLGIKEAPGNAGLKDQVAALKWVQRNIKAFGGDSDNVTIFGESAGAACVSYHVLSPMSKELFHKGIMQSGSSLASWALQFEPLQAASDKAKLLGFDSKDPYELYNFLKNQTDRDLVINIVPRPKGDILMAELIFRPCLEKEFEGVEPFLTETSIKMFSRGNFTKVPMILGVNSEEGLFFVNTELDQYIPEIKIEQALPKHLAFPSIVERREVAKEVSAVFMGGKEVSYQTLYNFSKYIGETFMEYPVFEETDLIVTHSDKPVYNYFFSYDGWRNLPKILLKRKQLWGISGASHADDLLYLFSQNLPSLFEDEMIDTMTTLWTNFAKYGDPTPAPCDRLRVRWTPVTKEDENHQILRIDTKLEMIPRPKKRSYELWKKVLAKYRRTH